MIALVSDSYLMEVTSDPVVFSEDCVYHNFSSFLSQSGFANCIFIVALVKLSETSLARCLMLLPLMSLPFI